MIRKDELIYHLSVDYCSARTEFSVIRYTNINVMLGNRNRLERDMLFP